MGHLRADLWSTLDEAWGRPRSRACGLPCPRFPDKFNYAAERLLRSGRRVRAEIRQRRRGRNRRCADAALRHLDFGGLDDAVRGVASRGTSLGTVITRELERL